jgi:hypothetical protein
VAEVESSVAGAESSVTPASRHPQPARVADVSGRVAGSVAVEIVALLVSPVHAYEGRVRCQNGECCC